MIVSDSKKFIKTQDSTLKIKNNEKININQHFT